MRIVICKSPIFVLAMRKIVFLFLFSFILLCSLARAQTNIYHPFPDSNATWNVVHSLMPCPITISARYTYYFGTDTLINSVTYHSIYKNGIVYPNACSSGHPVGYKGAIRQDTILRKVFIVLANEISEKILYDFNLHNIGDTINMLCGIGTCTLHVTGIDSILIDSTYRKLFWYDCAPSINQADFLIEGIGKSLGFLEECLEGNGVFTGLECFTQNNRTIYPDTTTQCDLLNSIEGIFSIKNIFIYPNPTTSIFTLQTIQPFINSTLTITNTLGEKILEQKIISERTEINLSSQSGGIYFVKVMEGNKMAVRKIVLM